jgi:hypothetical protein
MAKLVPFVLHISIYNALLESYASEHSARMLAMKNSTDNCNQSVLWWILAMMSVGMYSVVDMVSSGGGSLMVFSVSIAQSDS